MLCPVRDHRIAKSEFFQFPDGHHSRLTKASILEYSHLLVRGISALAENQWVCTNDLVEETLFKVILQL